ncbi:MAG TPA: hypothetical protein VK797_01950 [Tepidisphaeraceae bacterium]|nr:hypothetical protein [Tepidisphaeraceae bacterium]
MSDPAFGKSDPSEAHVPWETLDAEEEGAVEDDALVSDGYLPPLPLGEGRGEGKSAAPPERPHPNPLAGGKGARLSEEEVPLMSGGGWTLPLLCAGVALIACCALIPQSDANRRLAYERQTLQMDLQTVQKQIAVNEEFLRKVGQDPTLAERLAERQMKVIPQGSRVLELQHDSGGASMSPFQLVSVPPPAPLPPYKPVGGFLAGLCHDNHCRLYVIGVALGMIATGLILGGSPETK